MRTLNRLLIALTIFSYSFTAYGSAAEKPDISTRAEASQDRNVDIRRTMPVGFSETTDVDIWVTYHGLESGMNPHVRVQFANLGVNYSYSREYFLVITTPDHTWIYLDDHMTGVLAPNAFGEKVFFLPKSAIGDGGKAEVGLFGTDDNPSNDYGKVNLPLTQGL